MPPTIRLTARVMPPASSSTTVWLAAWADIGGVANNVPIRNSDASTWPCPPTAVQGDPAPAKARPLAKTVGKSMKSDVMRPLGNSRSGLAGGFQVPGSSKRRAPIGEGEAAARTIRRAGARQIAQGIRRNDGHAIGIALAFAIPIGLV